MATTRQIQANRANAKRSTGPVTEAGKQASSQNATRHGLLSGCLVLKSESKEKWENLLATYVQEFQPSTPNEFFLVETMAAARWRMARNRTIQTVTLEIQTSDLDPEEGSDTVLAAMAFGKSADSSQALHLLQRYETALDRQYSRALNNLRKVRADNTLHSPRTPEETPAPTTHPEATKPDATQTGAHRDPQPGQGAHPPGNKTFPLPIEANSPPSPKVVRPASLAARRFQSHLNREYRILHPRKPFRVTQREQGRERASSFAEQSRQTRLARAL